MGSWGYGPLENDSAGDWLMPVHTHVTATIERTVNTVGDEPFLRRSWDGFAAIGLLLALADIHGGYAPDDVYAGIQILDRMIDLGEPTYFGWKDPQKRQDVLKEYRGRLKRLWSQGERARGRRRRSR